MFMRCTLCFPQLLRRLSLEASGNFPWKLMMKLQHSLCFVLTRPGQTTGEAEADRWHHAGHRTADSGLGEPPLLWLNQPCMCEGGNEWCSRQSSFAFETLCHPITQYCACECAHYMGVCYA